MKNMFEIKYRNLKVNDLLSYIDSNYKTTGLCSWCDYSYDLIKQEIKQISKGKSKRVIWQAYPIESSILSKKKKKLDVNVYGSYSFNDVNSEYVKLRYWWAYNLAVVASQQP